MKGITFGAFHSYRDLGLILGKKEISSPTVKENRIPIEGADSDLDLTEYFGEPKYDNARHKFEFSTIVPEPEFLSLFSTVKNALHGKKMRIILDDDPLFYYVGRLYVSSFTSEKNIGKISVEADCEPYKYAITETVITKDINGTTVVILTNSRKRVTPTITTNAAMTFTFGGYSTTRPAGTFIIPELELIEGANTVTVSGTGNVSFKWRNAVL